MYPDIGEFWLTICDFGIFADCDCSAVTLNWNHQTYELMALEQLTIDFTADVASSGCGLTAKNCEISAQMLSPPPSFAVYEEPNLTITPALIGDSGIYSIEIYYSSGANTKFGQL